MHIIVIIPLNREVIINFDGDSWVYLFSTPFINSNLDYSRGSGLVSSTLLNKSILEVMFGRVIIKKYLQEQ